MQRALAERGVESVVVAWDDPDVDWGVLDLVVVRSTWDSVDRPDEFLRWIHAAAAATRIENPAPVLAWNLDKGYLDDLERAGLPVVPTTWVRPGDTWMPPAAPFVVKPAISGGGRETARYDRRSDEAVAHVARLHAHGRTAMVQPYLTSVDTRGETKMVFVDGRFSHALRVGPLLRADAGVMDTPWEVPVAVTVGAPSGAELDVAHAVVGDAIARFGRLLYSRVDVASDDDGTVVLMELELVDPSLSLWAEPDAARRFATAIAARSGVG